MGVPTHFVVKNTPYRSLIPQSERGKLLERLQPCVGRQIPLEYEVFVRDLCLFTKQDIPDFSELEQYHTVLDTDFFKKLSQEVQGDLFEQVAENLRRIRNTAQLSKEKMSELLQISDYIYHRIESASPLYKFPATMSSRCWLATGIHPIYLLEHSRFFILRCYQGAKIRLLNEILARLSPEVRPEILNFARAITSLHRTLSPSTENEQLYAGF